MGVKKEKYKQFHQQKEKRIAEYTNPEKFRNIDVDPRLLRENEGKVRSFFSELRASKGKNRGNS